MSNLMAPEFLPTSNDVRISIEFTGTIKYFINGIIASSTIQAHAARAEEKMREVGITPKDRLGFAHDIFTHLSITPASNEKELHACVDLALWMVKKQGGLDDLSREGANWLRLQWSALASQSQEPFHTLDRCPTTDAHWNAAA